MGTRVRFSLTLIIGVCTTFYYCAMSEQIRFCKKSAKSLIPHPIQKLNSPTFLTRHSFIPAHDSTPLLC